MEPSQKITDYINNFGDWRTERLQQLRSIINEAAPDSKEEYKWNCPVWSQGGMLLAISGFKDHIKINFFKGASYPDQSHFNNGLDSKDHRSIDFFENDKIDEQVIKQLVGEALKANKK